jgi:zinc/manganese transport system substrate-binding protein
VHRQRTGSGLAPPPADPVRKREGPARLARVSEASQFVARIEIPTVIDRSQGDIHPGGNPHIHTDPRNIALVAEALLERLARIDAAGAEAYKGRAASFRERWRAAVQRWEQQAAPLKGMPVVVYHKDMSYLIRWLGLREVGSLEPKPGIPPSPTQLAELIQRLQREPARAVVYAAYNDPRAAQFLSERTRMPAVMLPFTVGGSDRAKDLFGLFDDTLSRLLAAAR